MRLAGVAGIIAVLCLLYLWIRARHLLLTKIASMTRDNQNRFGASIGTWMKKSVRS